jgi:hypothetical protein
MLSAHKSGAGLSACRRASARRGVVLQIPTPAGSPAAALVPLAVVARAGRLIIPATLSSPIHSPPAAPATPPAPPRTPDRRARPRLPTPHPLQFPHQPLRLLQPLAGLQLSRLQQHLQPASRSPLGTCHRSPCPRARSPLVVVTAVRPPVSPADRNRSTTGAPTPVASTTSRHGCSIFGCRITSQTRFTTRGYGVPNSIRSRCPTLNSRGAPIHASLGSSRPTTASALKSPPLPQIQSDAKHDLQPQRLPIHQRAPHHFPPK